MKIAVISSHTPSLFWFRMDMMKEFIRRGCEVIAIGNESEKHWKEIFLSNGITYFCAKIERNGTNPLKDIETYYSIKNILLKERPDKIFAYQAKTVIYGCLAAHRVGIEDICSLIAGVGSVFMNGGIKAGIIRTVLKAEYRIGLKYSKKVMFQNRDDVALFLNNRIIKKDKVVMINGSGVNLEHFVCTELPENTAFLCTSRLIRDKGVVEYLEAAKIVKQRFPDVRFMLVGPFDTNPSALKKEELQPYLDSGIAEYFGEQSDVRPYLEKCSVFVLPSYREGTPKSILEAMSCGRAVITTDAPGCRETVIDGENGFLVPVKNSRELAEKMIYMIKNPEILKSMALKSRVIAEDKFDVNKVNNKICDAMDILNLN